MTGSVDNLASHLEEEKPEPNFEKNEILPSVPNEFYEEEDNIVYPDLLNYYNNNLQNYVHPNTNTNIQFQFTFGQGGEDQDWVYSKSLDKLFIKMEKIVPMRFHWEQILNPLGLYIRTKMVYKVEQYRNEPVRRCHNHMAPTYHINQKLDPSVLPYVVHCVNHRGASYEVHDNHLSILTQLGSYEPGTQYEPMCFQFLCKNSCPSGMNRRPTELLFTLEDSEGHVLGQKELSVRVCSCPKRDKLKEEKELKKTSEELIRQNSGNKMSSCDTHPYKVDISVAGKENFLSVLKYAHDVMAGQASRTGQYQAFKPYMDAILRKIP
ncbi:cellular tumor antigen p53 isoform X2 [Pseudomyrmex gracilis]|uniref:cellular tumor antigen p53 isoform X2 n=1 Tax=Pseudomyrmex gracilis TaxID=219809 RepID=UPI000994A9A9|nr:cellular tumor antigen p53 isoform X2 [Pseudomyrmex gracilis]